MIDTEITPAKLCQGEAIDNLLSLRFATFYAARFSAPADIVLYAVETNKQIGTVRAFFTEPAVVSYLVTIDYESGERLMLENDQLGLCVEYNIADVDTDEVGEAIRVNRFSLARASLVRTPKTYAIPNTICLPLRPAKAWRWA